MLQLGETKIEHLREEASAVKECYTKFFFQGIMFSRFTDRMPDPFRTFLKPGFRGQSARRVSPRVQSSRQGNHNGDCAGERDSRLRPYKTGPLDNKPRNDQNLRTTERAPPFFRWSYRRQSLLFSPVRPLPGD